MLNKIIRIVETPTESRYIGTYGWTECVVHVHYFVLFTFFLYDVGSMRKSDVDQLSSSHNSICGPEARKKKKKARDTLALPAKDFALCTPMYELHCA